MKKKITSIVLGLLVLSTTTAFVKYQNGIAGFTGAPGEGNCSSCHGGGASSASGTTISAVPSFTNNEYVPGQNYVITIDLAASGFNFYGFGCEILNGNNANAGNMHAAGTGVQFLNSGSRRNAIHTTPKSGNGGTSFSFEWTAPTDFDIAKIYVAGNAVNGNSQFTLDFPMAPVNLQLMPYVAPEPVGVKEQSPSGLTAFSVYPNPATAMTQVSYYLHQPQTTHIELIELNGKVVKEFGNKPQAAGPHSQFLDLQGIAAGIYFMKISADGQKGVQKLISVQ